MDNILKNSIEKYEKQYRKIFKIFYPALGSDGFVERNQTNNFANSLLNSLADDNAFAWFEMSLEKDETERKRGHIDTVVFSPFYKSVFYIEAKRLSTYYGNYKKREDSINSDFERILSEPKRDSILNRKDFEVKNEYLICLADFWKSNNEPKFDNIKNNWITNKNYKIVFNSIEFEQGIFKEDCLKSYNLLIAYAKISKNQ